MKVYKRVLFKIIHGIDIEGKSIGAHGEIKYNNFLKSNIFKAFDLEIQKGYVIDRKIV